MRKLIYIMGCAHCGSTLLTTLLGRHSQIATVGELKLTKIPDDPDYQCGCGERLKECSFWKNVTDECEKKSMPFSFPETGMHYSDGTGFSKRVVGTMVRGGAFEGLRSLALKFWPPSRKLLSSVNDRNSALVDAVCSIEGKDVFLDGSKDPTRLRHFIDSGEFDVKPIFLVRDGRAITASYKKRNADIKHCLNLWKLKAQECENLVKWLDSDNLLTLRYEDLCKDVEGSLSKIFSFVGVADESGACMAPVEHASKHIIGHASRLKNAGEIRLREEWKTILTRDDLKKFAEQEEGLNRIHGYDGTADDPSCGDECLQPVGESHHSL